MNALDAIVAASQTSTESATTVEENQTETIDTAVVETTTAPCATTEKPWLLEWDTGMWFAPASIEQQALFAEAQKKGNDYFLYPYFGYHLKMLVAPRTAEDFRFGISSKHNKLV